MRKEKSGSCRLNLLNPMLRTRTRLVSLILYLKQCYIDDILQSVIACFKSSLIFRARRSMISTNGISTYMTNALALIPNLDVFLKIFGLLQGVLSSFGMNVQIFAQRRVYGRYVELSLTTPPLFNVYCSGCPKSSR